LKLQGATFSTTASPWLLFGGSGPEGVGNWPTSLVIDPVNSSHVLYATGQTVWDTANISISDTNGKAAFNVAAQGIEECVVQSLMSPTTGPLVVRGVGDLGGFVHTSLTASPATGMIANPILGVGTGLDFAQALPATMARVGSSGVTFGGYSINNGTLWTAFKTVPAGSIAGQGAVAVSADGTTFVWAPSDAPVAYSTTNGTTWTASTGATAQSGIVSDRINARKFYIFTNGTLQISTTGGVSFTTAATGLPSSSGLYHSTNSGTSFTKATGFSQASLVTFGKASYGAAYPAIYVNGVGSNGYGFYRSIDGGATWYQINDANHQYGYIPAMAGDPKTYGRIYIGTGGRGVIYGDSPY
jgi:xyloglucan-specific exo-beta-1,4-glucanase